MSQPKKIHLFNYFIIAFITLQITGCFVGTKDIEAKDSRAEIFSGGAEYRFHERWSAMAEYAKTSGKDSQNINSGGVQLNGERIESLGQVTPLKHDFDLEALLVGMKFHWLDKDFLKINAEAGIQHFAYELQTRSATASINESNDQVDPYVKAEIKVPLNQKLSLVASHSLSLGDVDPSQAALFAEYQPSKSILLLLGFKRFGFDETGIHHDNYDSCSRSPAQRPCDNSDVKLSAQGLMAGLKFLF